MITPRIKALFRFIDYLYSNIETYKKYSKDIDDLNLLRTDQRQLKPKNNYKDRLRSNELNEAIERKQNILYDKITAPIQAKAIELNICDFFETNQYYKGEWRNNFLPEVEKLKRNFHNSDLPEIFTHKTKYHKVRTETKDEVSFGLEGFFNDLDGLLQEFFDFFKDTEQKEFEAFETKAIQVNNIGEAVDLLKKGHKKFTLPNSFLNPSIIQQQSIIDPLPPHQTQTLSDLITHKYSREIVEGLKIQYKNIKGKRLKLLLLALQDLDLLPKERIANKFYDCCNAEFNWNIASYNAMNGAKYNEITDFDDFHSMKEYIKALSEQKKPLA